MLYGACGLFRALGFHYAVQVFHVANVDHGSYDMIIHVLLVHSVSLILPAPHGGLRIGF